MISKKLFGTLSDGREVDIYELKNANGVSASVITYGATWQSLFAPDRDGNFEDVLIGFEISRVMSSARTIRVKLSADMLIASAADILPLTAKKLML
mgnify:CR=1 FL=1